jgi:hypothetical protein
VAPSGTNPTERERGSEASLMPTSWNQIIAWFQKIDALREAA